MGIRDRPAWNARSPRSVVGVPLSHWLAIRVHHSAGPVGQSIRTIQNFHMDTRGWADIGYSHLIQDGEIWAGRGWSARPAHDLINDTLGVCMVGTYADGLPSAEDLDALVRYVRLARAEVGRRLPVDGHRDAAGASTACPGDALHEHLPEIRRRADEEEDDVSAEDVWDYAIDDPIGADRHKRANTMLAYAFHRSRSINSGVAELLQLVRELAAGHELTAEQIEAAAKRGAEAALDPTELGEAIAAHLRDVPPEQVQAAVQAGVREVLGSLDEG